MNANSWIGKQMVCPPEACALYELEPGVVVKIVAEIDRAVYGRGCVLVQYNDKSFAVFESRLKVPKGMKQKRPLP